MQLLKPLLLLSSISLLSGCIVIANSSYADHKTERQLQLTADNLTFLDVNTEAGALIISGAKTDQISVSADVYTKRGDVDSYELELSSRGDTATLIAKIDSSGFWKGQSPHIDIRVSLPKNMSISIEDGSGDISISNITGTLDINDGSGDMRIDDIKGKVNIDDNSGDIIIRNIKGNVEIDDNSGEITAENFQGDLKLEDGSGDIRISGITGNAFIEDSSGDLTVRDIDGSVTIDDGSGDINVKRVGSLKIIESGSGGLHVKQVKAGFEIEQ